MKIPNSGRKKALIVVDAQPSFIKPRNKRTVANIVKLLQSVDYDFYVESTFLSQKNSIWGKQLKYKLDRKETTIPEIKSLLPDDVFVLVKSTKSTFRNDAKLMKILKKKKIHEVHIVGFVTNDCVLATAFDAFDSKFFTYVIEECVDSSTKQLHDAAIKVLRKQALTNNSVREKIKFVNL